MHGDAETKLGGSLAGIGPAEIVEERTSPIEMRKGIPIPLWMGEMTWRLRHRDDFLTCFRQLMISRPPQACDDLEWDHERLGIW